MGNKRPKPQTKLQKGGKRAASSHDSGKTLDPRRVAAPPAKEGPSTAPNMRNCMGKKKR